MISIIVKCPSHLSESFECQLADDATVGSLKEYLRGNHPLRPAVESQRFVYRGSILSDDDASLLELYNQAEHECMTIHMVVKEDLSSGPPAPKMTEQEVPPVLEAIPMPSPNISITPVPSFPAQSSSNYSYFDSRGELVHRDLSKAVIFNGTSFFKVRPQHQHQHQEQQQQQQQQQRPRNLPNVQPRHLFQWAWRIEIDISRFYTLFFRIFVVVMLFSHSMSRLKLGLFCAALTVIFLLQSGILPIPRFVRTMIENPPAFLQQPRQQEEQQPNPPDGTQRIPPQSPVQPPTGIFQLLRSFVTSLLPSFQAVA